MDTHTTRTDGPDGYTDLTLQFKTQQIVEQLLEDYDDLAQGQTQMLELIGELSNGFAMTGNDCVVFAGNVSKWLIAKSSDINRDGTINIFALTELAAYWLESSEIE